MKKLIISLLIFITIVIAGCSQNSAPSSQVSTETGEVTLWIIRHGKTMLNTTDRAQGWADAPLTPAGLEVISYLAKGLQDVAFVAAYSSDSGRARETAKLILAKQNHSELTLQDDGRLREFNFGTYEGAPNHEMWGEVAMNQGKSPEVWIQELMASGSMSVAFFADSIAHLDKEKVEPGINWPAEDFNTISNRLMSALDDITQKHPLGGDILIVSHGLSMMAILENIDPLFKLEGMGFDNGALLKITYTPARGYRIVVANDMSYVEKGKNLQS